MIETTVKIDGMQCGMCEAHINETVRAHFPVKKVSSSHKKGEAVLLSEQPLDEGALRAAIERTGYTVTDLSEREVGEKKGLFGFLKK